MANILARSRQQTVPKTNDKLTSRRSAVTVEEIAQRLFTISRRLEDGVEKGEGLNVEEARYIADKLRRYAMRLRASPKFSGS